ncbi:MAG: sulfotransferase [Jatrophihabitans endophyticus]|nr:sulfotransferase [Jatrophihabitans endophyticus]
MALPNFLVAGAPKAGSTAVHAALVRHPELFLSVPKEPKYFMTGGVPPRRRDHRGPGDAHSAREWIWDRRRYEALFDAAPPGTLRGESTPFYLWDVDAHRRIAAAIPDVRIIAVIRDPVDRAYSNWTHLRSNGLEPEADFRTACRLEPERVANGWAPFWRYLDLGRYGEQLTSLYEHVPAEQVHVIRYRELIDDPARALDAVCEFLGVSTGVLDTIPGSNLSAWAGAGAVNTGLRAAVRSGAWFGSFAPPERWRRVERQLLKGLHRGQGLRPDLPVEVRRDLTREFADDIAVLEGLLGRSFQDWLGDAGRGTFAVRSSLAPSAREASQ